MTQTPLETDAASPYATLITLTWGALPGANVARYARWSSDVAVAGDTFTAEPKMAIDLNTQHGGTDDAPVKITVPRTLTPFDVLATGVAHAPVTVSVQEVAPSDDTTLRDLFWGRIQTIRVNPAGRSALVTVAVQGIKARLDVVMGINATTTCPWRLGDQQCKVDLAAITQTGTVSELNVDGWPHRVRLLFSTEINLDNNRWRRGYLEVDGLRLMIRKTLSKRRFDLVRQPPAAWLAAAVSAVPGCDKRIETCRAVYNNESNFGGIGYAMPAYNPVFETT